MITGQGENGAISILAKQFQGYTTLLSLSDPNDDDDDQIGEEKAGRLHRDGGMRPANPSVLHHIPPKKYPQAPISQQQPSSQSPRKPCGKTQAMLACCNSPYLNI